MKRILSYVLVLCLFVCMLTSCEALDKAIAEGLDGLFSTILPSPDNTPDAPVVDNPPDDGTQGGDDTTPDVGGGTLGGITDETDLPTSDPYTNISKTQFYANYTPASNYKDAEYRTKHYLMSGSIANQDQEPNLSNHQPKIGNTLLRNSAMLYADDGNTYFVLDAYGNVANKIYKGGAYVTLEEVAAYVFAFGTVPANYTSDKDGSPLESDWGKYLRLNNSYFSGDTDKYPYEPVLPNISGCGGTYQYYEIDIGTTGTDCDPDYAPVLYNNGTRITRGAARIVYARYEYGKQLTGTYVFYTYNHYNDFQEYLNYEGGWGKMFGNITGGGTISSKYDYNPTSYVESQLSDFSEFALDAASLEIVALLPSNKLYLSYT